MLGFTASEPAFPTSVLVIGAVVTVQVMKGNKPAEVYTEKAEIRDIIEVVSATGKTVTLQPKGNIEKNPGNSPFTEPQI